MGYSSIVVLAPYIKIPIQHKTVENEIYTCGEHINLYGEKYCPRCGKENFTEKVYTNRRIWINELIEEVDLFYEYVYEDFMYIFSNKRLKYSISTDYDVFTTITPELINSAISEFKDTYFDKIKLLEQKIGFEVNVEFGFVTYQD